MNGKKKRFPAGFSQFCFILAHWTFEGGDTFKTTVIQMLSELITLYPQFPDVLIHPFLLNYALTYEWLICRTDMSVFIYFPFVHFREYQSNWCWLDLIRFINFHKSRFFIVHSREYQSNRCWFIIFFANELFTYIYIKVYINIIYVLYRSNSSHSFDTAGPPKAKKQHITGRRLLEILPVTG